MPRASEWIHQQPESIVDFGCKVGAGLLEFRRLYPAAKLAGIDIKRPALEVTRIRLAFEPLRVASANTADASHAR